MENQTEVLVEIQTDNVDVQPLVRFFEPFAALQVSKKPRPSTAKTMPLAVNLIVTIVGTWAAERFVLDPLADRAEEWWNALCSSWQKSRHKHPVSLLVRFERDAERADIELTETTDPRALKRMWHYVKKAYGMQERLRSMGVQLDQVRVLVDGTDRVLTIGYEGVRPRHIIDLQAGTYRPIGEVSTTSGLENVERGIFLIRTLIRALEYRRFLRGMGYAVSKDEIAKLEGLIEEEKQKLVDSMPASNIVDGTSQSKVGPMETD